MGTVADGWRAPIRRVGGYDLGRLIGRGGMASVFAAVHTEDGTSAAVKLLHPHLTGDRISVARLLREGRTLSRIAHPNIVRVLDAGDSDGVPYLVMPLVEGDDLSDHLRRHHPMPLQDIIHLMLPVIEAVAAAHEAGVIHRDLKPRNIRVERREDGALVPKVLDFGISKWTEAEATADLTTTGEALGTVSYMAPEQLRCARGAEERSDVYALGVILYECATGRRPFQGQSPYALMHEIMTTDVELPSACRRDLPAEFDEVVLRAMRREPSLRFASARELGIALSLLASRREDNMGCASTRRAEPLGTRVLADGSILRVCGQIRLHMTEFGNGVVRHTCAGRLPAEFCSSVTRHGDEQIAEFGRVIFMVDLAVGGLSHSVATGFRDGIAQWFRARRDVAVAHILIRSKLLDMAISVTNLVTGSPALRPYTNALQWEAVGRCEAAGFTRLKSFPR